MSSVPCIVVAGTHSGVGKTSVATALMNAFVRRGLRVQGFKVGPDFIDPGFHRIATGRASHNLDGWMLSRTANLSLYARASQDADLCIVEGVMGLFDGRSATSESGSTAELAKWIGAPVVLVVDGSAMARSVAALVHGFESFDPELRISGVLFNRISGEKHFSYLRDSTRAHCQATLLGYLERDSQVKLPERHLGLHLADEVLTPEMLGNLAEWVQRSVDLDHVMQLARSAEAPYEGNTREESLPAKARARIAIAKDLAFQFYYEDNLDRLRRAGAELIEFSPIDDSTLPDGIGGVYFGGGYPELHAAALAANKSMRDSVRAFAEADGPIYAECGGFMYLTEGIVDQNGRQHEMCGLFPTRARMHQRLAGLGYAELEVISSGSWLPSGQLMRGHEFRYSSIDPMPDTLPRVYEVRRASRNEMDGFSLRNLVASYFHVHFGSCPELPKALVAAASVMLQLRSETGRTF
ncbi:MAG: cobyrinate a,c-diamide synthase [Candidatus Acidiferrales bacterium]